jgi:hypothetical protein
MFHQGKMAMTAVPVGWQSFPLFIEVTVRNIEDQIAPRFDDAPPVTERNCRVRHMFKV